MSTQWQNLKPRLAVVLHDLAMVWAAWMSVFWLRYQIWEQSPPLPWWPPEMPLVLLVQGLVLYTMGLYKGIWRFASLPDLWNIIRATMFGALVISVSLFLLNRLEGVPRSVLLMYPLVLMALLGVPRLLYRVWKDRKLAFYARPGLRRVLLLGAGSTGDLLARDMRREGPYYPVGFLDDDRRLWGARLRDLPVFGGIEDLPEVASRNSIDTVVIAIPSASNRQMQRIVAICEDVGVDFLTVPRLQDLLGGRSSAYQIKEVAIEDLLGRDPASLDWGAIRSGLAGRAVLVTGGGGSIGAELCRQIAQLGPSRLGVLERSEFNLYQIDRELRRDHPELVLQPMLGDVCDNDRVERTLEQFKPDIIFHAAAHKHVPLLEANVREAIRNNVGGTRSIATAADRHGVDSFVLISTDKAVNPVSVMGATKRAAEILCQSLAGPSATRFVTVRFGNVLDSAGSVVPLFREQIRRGGPVTVTHPEVTRYFMTIAEACQLIMQVAATGDTGEIYLLDMGDPIRIQYLAEQMILLAGKKPGDEIEIAYTGLRPGEKMFEELFHELEPFENTEHSQILLARHREFDWQPINQDVLGLIADADRLDDDQLRESLRRLVPEFRREDTDPKVINLNQKLKG